MVVTTHGLSEVDENGGLLGVRAGRLGDGIVEVPDALKSNIGGKPGITLKDTCNGANMSRQLNQSRNPILIEPTTKADIRPDNDVASLNCATMLHSRNTNVGNGSSTGHPVKASVNGGCGSKA